MHSSTTCSTRARPRTTSPWCAAWPGSSRSSTSAWIICSDPWCRPVSVSRGWTRRRRTATSPCSSGGSSWAYPASSPSTTRYRCRSAATSAALRAEAAEVAADLHRYLVVDGELAGYAQLDPPDEHGDVAVRRLLVHPRDTVDPHQVLAHQGDVVRGLARVEQVVDECMDHLQRPVVQAGLGV